MISTALLKKMEKPLVNNKVWARFPTVSYTYIEPNQIALQNEYIHDVFFFSNFGGFNTKMYEKMNVYKINGCPNNQYSNPIALYST